MARSLSVKITQSLLLSSEQLSTQTHYDYGMRAVKSIILAAGVLKRTYPDDDEFELCLRAISSCNIPKFVNPDIPQFKGIISDLFPTTSQDKAVNESLHEAILQSLQE
jgi:dynein heavy chain